MHYNCRPRNEKHGKTVSKGYPHIVASLLKGYSGDGSELLVDITDTDIEARPEGDDEVARLRIIGKDLWKKRAGVIANGFLSDSYSFKDSE